MKYKSILFSAVAISFAPIGYILGLFYYQGKLNAFGIDSDNFPLSIQDAYVNAFYFFYYETAKSLLAVMKIIMYVTEHIYIFAISIAAALVIMSIIIAFKNEIRRNFTKTSYSIKNIHPCLPLRMLGHLFSAFKLLCSIISPIYLVFYVAFMFLFLIFIIPYWAYNTGKINAFESLARYNKVGCLAKAQQLFSDCITYKTIDQKKEISGILIHRGSDTIAIYNGIDSTIYKITDSYLIKKEVVQPKI
ncbi:hypothetical protein [uncultured Tolumonas sp.]|uniref:hypothetical protein n=1 Tax=uncultured Tolumonas sp. TaxID=263765 RepID=UPI00292D20ED|nr:hypothetical protein [uncultured Tolumonas sp.]